MHTFIQDVSNGIGVLSSYFFEIDVWSERSARLRLSFDTNNYISCVHLTHPAHITYVYFLILLAHP